MLLPANRRYEAPPRADCRITKNVPSTQALTLTLMGAYSSLRGISLGASASGIWRRRWILSIDRVCWAETISQWATIIIILFVMISVASVDGSATELPATEIVATSPLSNRFAVPAPSRSGGKVYTVGGVDGETNKKASGARSIGSGDDGESDHHGRRRSSWDVELSLGAPQPLLSSASISFNDSRNDTLVLSDLCLAIRNGIGKCMAYKTATGYLVEVFEPRYVVQAECSSFLLLPAENTWSVGVKAVLYFFGIIYCFVGLITITAVFMRAMDVIVNQKYVVLRINPVTGHLEKEIRRVWNNTIADITLLAFGTSAPQISLALIDAMQSLGQPPGGLGPGTIIGSAAFNLFPILAVCVLVPKAGQIKRVENFGVWLVEYLWSMWAYVWLLIILEVWSPNVISVEESVLTVLQFPVLIMHAYAQDKGWWRRRSWRSKKARGGSHFVTPEHPPQSSTVDDARELEDVSMVPQKPELADRRLSWGTPVHSKIWGSQRTSFVPIEEASFVDHMDKVFGYGSSPSFSITERRPAPPPTPPQLNRASSLLGEQNGNEEDAASKRAIENGGGGGDGERESQTSQQLTRSLKAPLHHRLSQIQSQSYPSQHRMSQAQFQPPPSNEPSHPYPLPLPLPEQLTWEETKSLWTDQFLDAMTVKGSVNSDDEEAQPPSLIDFILHTVCFFWKVLFAFIPPPNIWHGRLTFASAVGCITAMSYVLIDLANLLGCVTGINPFVMAITVLASGTCLPDLIGSFIATKNDATADSAIANINASNSINVFIGLGLPWLIGSVYNRTVMDMEYSMTSKGLGFSVLIFFVTASTCTLVLLFRRFWIGGELGGPRHLAVISSAIFLFHWFVYLLLSSMKAYKMF